MIKKGKIVLSLISPGLIKSYEGLIVARPTGLVRIKRVYLGNRLDYCFLEDETAIVSGNIRVGFYAVVAWFPFEKDEELLYLPVAQSEVRFLSHYLPKQGYSFLTQPPYSTSGKFIKLFINERYEAYSPEFMEK